MCIALHNAAIMPGNPHSNIGGGALIQIDIFKLVVYPIHKYVKLLSSNNKTYKYERKENLINNGLDYITVEMVNDSPLNWI